ncbi:hypothetical protein [Nocardia sp. NPDC057272]|uniref:hypothetical protein n=1 Tax=Nocardia sp. NPDC057272 TaxID=3346079 RepID=UPI003643A55B
MTAYFIVLHSIIQRRTVFHGRVICRKFACRYLPVASGDSDKGELIDPLPGLHSVGLALADHGKWWSQAYFAEVARRADQVAVMSYDTAMPTRALYSGYVAQQTELAAEVTPDGVDLLMGAPAFWADDPGHHGAAETVAAAVRGIRLGLTDTDVGRANFGVALYVDFAATPQDWADYRREWCRTTE